MGITIGALADTEEKREALQRLCYTYKDIFATDLKDIKRTDLVKHAIPTRPDARPHCAKMPVFTREEELCVSSKIPELEAAGIIARCDSPWNSRLKFVRKKDGTSLRWVNVFCPLNKVTIKEPYPIPRLESIFAALARPSHKVFCSMDGSNGYWGIPMVEEDVPKTAFFTPMGQFCWTVMGQGLAGAVFTYSRFGDIAFGSIPAPFPQPRLEDDDVVPGVVFRKFMDDNYVGADDFWALFRFLAEHYFPRCAWAPVSLAPLKCHLAMASIDVMGFTSSEEGLRPNLGKLRAFEDYLSPRTPEEVERFCYMTPFLRWFIPGRAEHVRRMKTALQDPSGFRWTDECEASFQTVKQAVLANAISAGDPNRQYHLSTDASATGCGGVLFQIFDDRFPA